MPNRPGWLIAGLLMIVSSSVFAQDTIYDNALWMGGLVLFENEDRFDFSVEYQLRLDDDMSSFSNHFVEFMGYNKVNENLVLNKIENFESITGRR